MLLPSRFLLCCWCCLLASSTLLLLSCSLPLRRNKFSELSLLVRAAPRFARLSVFRLAALPRAMSSFAAHANPLLRDWSRKNHGLPPFAEISPSLYEEALTIAMKEHVKEIEAIVNCSEAPTFENTVLALDQSGELFSQVSETFSNMCGSIGVPELQEVEQKMASLLAAHYNLIANFPGLFARLDKVHAARHEGLDALQIRLTERFHLDAVRAGARFSETDKQRYSQIVQELADLCTKFTQNVMADEAKVYVDLDDTAGLPEDLIAAAKQAGIERGAAGPVVTLSRSLVEPFLTYSDNRALREKAWRLWTRRGELDKERNNLPIARRILELRAEQARMHGYRNFGEYATADTMAASPGRVQTLLEEVWQRAQSSVARERQELEAFVKTSGLDLQADDLAPWDWRYLAEKVRCASYTLDNSEVKKYFPLDKMVCAIFDVAQRLFGLRFVAVDLPAYHPDVQVYEVFAADGTLQALFLHDNYARPHKRSGAWMSELRTQAYAQGRRTVPIVMNNNNFNRPASGRAADCLLTFDDARTLFHEFGHGLHGMLSDVRYRRLASTSVLRDFVELPSQLYEHWLAEPAVLQVHARHFQSDAPLPVDLLQRMQAAHSFGQGFQTIEYTASALLDARLHQVPAEELHDLDLAAWEADQLRDLGMPRGIVMRHRLPHFQHLFSGESYASAYYVYLWAEVLDADAFDAFKETGDCFDRTVAERVRKFVYSAGNSQDPAELFRLFRGRDPIIEPMLRKKGLLQQ